MAHNVKPLRTFINKEWGEVTIHEEKYAAGGLAIQLTCVSREMLNFHEPLARLSVWLEKATDALPHNCFYAKDWSENERLATEAAASGWFKLRSDLPFAFAGRGMVCEAWELLDVRGKGFDA